MELIAKGNSTIVSPQQLGETVGIDQTIPPLFGRIDIETDAIGMMFKGFNRHI
jgi:hypothetical protein